MADPRAATASNAAKLAAPSAWYSAAVVGLAAFLGAMLVTHPPIQGYRTEVSLSRVPPAATSAEESGAAIDPAAVESWLESDAALHQIAANPGTAKSRFADASRLTEIELQSLRDRLHLIVTPQNDGALWSIRFEGRDRGESRRFAQRAAEVLAGHLDRLVDTRPSDAEIASLRREVRLVQDEEERLEDEIEQLRHEHLAGALLREGRRQAAERVSEKFESNHSHAASRRQSIVQKIDELRIEYRQLVATRLASHPSVAAVAGQIEQLEVQLREVSNAANEAPGNPQQRQPHHLQGPSASKTRSVTNAAFTSNLHAETSVADTSSVRIDEARLQLRETGMERKDAQRRLDAAVQLASTAWQKQWSVSGSGATQRIGGTPSGSDLLWAGIAGILAATTMSIDWTWFGRVRVLTTANQARNALPAPLLGEISLPAARPVEGQSTLSATKFRLVRMAEWMLIVSLLLVILAAVSQRELAAQLASDPFGAMAEAFDLVRGLVR